GRNFPPGTDGCGSASGIRGVTTPFEGVGVIGRTGIEAALRQAGTGVGVVVVVATFRTYRGAPTFPQGLPRALTE
ncbi:hypothetical protein ACO1MN_14160, partial [Staphylococcus aureus]